MSIFSKLFRRKSSVPAEKPVPSQEQIRLMNFIDQINNLLSKDLLHKVILDNILLSTKTYIRNSNRFKTQEHYLIFATIEK